MKILAIHDGHNASACLLEDGQIAFFCQEERFTYRKNEGGVPVITIEQIIARYGNNFDRVLFTSNYIGTIDWSREAHLSEMSSRSTWKKRLRQELKKVPWVYGHYKQRRQAHRLQRIRQVLGNREVEFLDHHFCHAASAYFSSIDPDRPTLVLTCDGDGDGRSASAFLGQGGILKPILSIPQASSLGALYSYFTFLYSMVPLEHEYKIMGLAPYCNDRKSVAKVKDQLAKVLAFRNENDLAWSYLGRHSAIQDAGDELSAIFRGFRFDVLAAGLQEFTEEILCEWVQRMVRATGITDIVCAGGVFMNVKANMAIADLPEVSSIFVTPSCGDESLPIGASYYAYFEATRNLPTPLGHLYFGDDVQVDQTHLDMMQAAGITARRCDDVELEIAKLLAEGQVVGRVRGRMEFGARSLGNRAILANPAVSGIRQLINDMIKGRDFWMPFAPSVLEEDFDKYFIRNKKVKNYNHMIFTAHSHPEVRGYANHALHPYDFSGRPHAVLRAENPDYHHLISCYKGITGEGLLLNTSYNLHGFPMVRDAQQAIHVLKNSGLEFLALGDYLCSKRG